MNPIEIEINYTAEDLQKSYLIHFKKQYPIRSKLLLIFGILLLILGVFLLILNYAIGHSIGLGVSYIIFGIAAIGFNSWNKKTIGIRMLKKLPDFRNRFNYTITEESIHIVNKNLNSVVKWEHFHDALISEDLILLYPNKFRYNLFPKHYFNDEQFEILKSLVKKNISIVKE